MCHIDWSATGAMLSGISAIIIAIITYCALSTAKKQIKTQVESSQTQQQAQRESTAKALFSRHLELCLQYPELSQPGREYKKDDHNQENFMAMTLFAYEEILEVAGDIKEWVKDIEYNLKEDSKVLAGLDKDKNYFDEGWSDRLLEIVRKIIDEKKSDANA